MHLFFNADFKSMLTVLALALSCEYMDGDVNEVQPTWYEFVLCTLIIGTVLLHVI